MNHLQNIPPGIEDPAYYDEPKYKSCIACGGDGLVLNIYADYNTIHDCEDCNGTGKVEMSYDEIHRAIETKKEPNNL